MTSKLPVVGKRYRQRETHQEVKVLNNFVRLRCAVDNFIYEEEGDYFNEFYEELPDSNPQEVEEDCPFETAAEEWNTAEEKEVSEVERALEGLKYHAQIMHYFDKEAALEDIKTASRNLIKALEAERNERAVMSKPEPKIDMKEERVEPVSIWKDVSERLDKANIPVETKMMFEVVAIHMRALQKDIEELKRKAT